MKISVVTIVYNDVQHIEGTLQSVFNQSAFDLIEYIVVDGASTDGTSAIIESYRDKLATYICEPDTGIYNAMNKGLRVASGDYVIFMNSGDVFSDNRVVENVINAAISAPDLIYGTYRAVSTSDASRVIPCRHHDKIWYGMVASHQSMFYSLQFLRRHNLSYDESYRIAADYKLTAEVIKRAHNVMQLDICISDFDTTGVSCNNMDMGLREANRVRQEVMNWSRPRILLVSVILLGARYTKKYLKPIYKLLRY